MECGPASAAAQGPGAAGEQVIDSDSEQRDGREILRRTGHARLPLPDAPLTRMMTSSVSREAIATDCTLPGVPRPAARVDQCSLRAASLTG